MKNTIARIIFLAANLLLCQFASACIKFYGTDGSSIGERWTTHSFRSVATILAVEDPRCRPRERVKVLPTSNAADWVTVTPEAWAAQPDGSFHTMLRVWFKDNTGPATRQVNITLGSPTAAAQVSLVSGGRNPCTPDVLFNNINGNDKADPNIRNRHDRIAFPLRTSSPVELTLQWRVPVSCPTGPAQRIDIPGQLVTTLSMSPPTLGPRSADSRYTVWNQRVSLQIPTGSQNRVFGVFFTILNKSFSFPLYSSDRQVGPVATQQSWSTIAAAGGITRVPFAVGKGQSIPQVIHPACTWARVRSISKGSIGDDGRPQQQSLDFEVLPNRTGQTRTCPVLVSELATAFLLFQTNDF